MRLTTTPTPGTSRVAGSGSKPTAWTIVALAAGLAVTFLLDRATDSAPVQHLYHAPIIFAALRLEWFGGLLASLSAVVLYHLANPTLLTFAYRESDFVQIALFIAVGLVTARLAENGRRLHAMAMTDDLTGLHNLRSFEGQLTTMMRSVRASGASIWMLVLDLDRLKSLNDTYGHLTGAEAVRYVGHVLATQLPSDAVACRYGGDEFAVCVPNRTEPEIRRIAELAVPWRARQRPGPGRASVPVRHTVDQHRCLLRAAPWSRRSAGQPARTSGPANHSSAAPTRRSTAPSVAGAIRCSSRVRQRTLPRRRSVAACKRSVLNQRTISAPSPAPPMTFTS